MPPLSGGELHDLLDPLGVLLQHLDRRETVEFVIVRHHEEVQGAPAALKILRP